MRHEVETYSTRTERKERWRNKIITNIVSGCVSRLLHENMSKQSLISFFCLLTIYLLRATIVYYYYAMVRNFKNDPTSLRWPVGAQLRINLMHCISIIYYIYKQWIFWYN